MVVIDDRTTRNFEHYIWNVIEIGQCCIFAVLWRPFWKWRPVEIFQCGESIRDIIIYTHMKCRWNRTMLNLCGIVAAILKMAIARIFSMSGINSGHHNLHTWNVVEIGQCWICAVLWRLFWKWRPLEITFGPTRNIYL